MDKRERGELIYKMVQPIFTAGMTPLEKVMVLSSVTNLVINLLTNGQKTQGDLQDDVLDLLNKFQYKLLIDPATRQFENPTILHIYNGLKGVMSAGALRFKPVGGSLPNVGDNLQYIFPLLHLFK